MDDVPTPPRRIAARRPLLRIVVCVVLFESVAILLSAGREIVRALALWIDGVPCTLYPLTIFYEPRPGTTTEAVLVSSSPVVFTAAAAIVGFCVDRLAPWPGLRLFGRYLAVGGAIFTLSEIFSMPFSGSLAFVPSLIDAPALVWATAATAAIVLAIVLWGAGARLQPPVRTILIPFAADLVLRPLVFAPTPLATILFMWAGASPWLVVVASAFWHRHRVPEAVRHELDDVRIRWSVRLAPLLLVLIVRLMAEGVRFGG